MRMAGPGAQIFVNGFRGGRLPPKDQIQQIRFHTNSFSAEYHEAGHDPHRGDHQAGHGRLARHDQLRVPRRIAERHAGVRRRKGPEQMRRYMVNFSGPIAKGKTGLQRVVRR
jgi:hypothetical protein